MEKFGKSQSVRRVEDVRFLTGAGRYTDDTAPADALHAVFLRSQVAHAEITALEVDAARAAPGVQAVLTAADLEEAGIDLGMAALTFPARDGGRGAAPMRPILARDRVRFVGEPVAVVVAETMAQAQDAAELIEFDYDELPPHVDRAPGGPQIHAEAPDNVALDFAFGREAETAKAFDAAAHVVALSVENNRIVTNTMEPRATCAAWRDGRLHLTFGGQGVWGVRDQLARAYGLDTDAVHVVTPDVGGGFGMKVFAYPEYLVLPEAARRTGRPVRWTAARGEAFLSDNSGRDLVSVAELAFDENLKITGYRVETTCNLGAYNSYMGQGIQTDLFTKVLTGCYDVQNAFMRTRCIYTNTTQVDAYRGAGRPEAITVLERAIDHAARVLGVDPWDLRRRNFIPAGKFPYRSATGELYDVGDFARVLDRAEAECDRAGFAARKADSAARGRLRGLGLCCYIESILGSPSEDVTVQFNGDGTATIFVGTQSNGQGHETVFASFLSDQTGLPFDHIAVVQGDSDRIARGGGTGGSRSVTVQTNATLKVVGTMIAAYSAFLAETLGAAREDVTFDEDRFRIAGSNETPGLLEAAAMARAAGRDDLLRFSETAELPGRSYPNGAHVAEVEIDPVTGVTEVLKYTVVDDFGNLINPMLAEGQVHGGVAQGIGQAVSERVVFDADGQLLSASLMDYALPRAADMPWIDFHTEPVPSTANPMGMKGCGEAGTVGALAAVGNAVLDAVWDRGVRQVDMPFTPSRVWKMLRQQTGESA